MGVLGRQVNVRDRALWDARFRAGKKQGKFVGRKVVDIGQLNRELLQITIVREICRGPSAIMA